MATERRTVSAEEVSMRKTKFWLIVPGLVLGLFAAIYLGGQMVMNETPTLLEPAEPPAGMARATFGAGCFWCTEAVFQLVKGVQSVVSGYSGGTVKGPTYRHICTGTTGHAEAIQVTYDPSVISYEDLLEVFWQTHDPTTRDRQGNDVGPQYRSVIFWHTDEQRQLAEHYKQKLDASGLFAAPIVTEIVPFTEFYRAEAYHQNYYANNSRQPYCRVIIGPKVEKVKKVFQDKLKTTASKER
jgi:peptide-methionine (S)-S-oxide reductase